jgi:hypothetical protein
MNTLTKRQATAAGYRALTHPYTLPREKALLENVLADLQRGNIDHVTVRVSAGWSVWRRASGTCGATKPCVPAAKRSRRRTAARKATSRCRRKKGGRS